jgi:hypothetical protein
MQPTDLSAKLKSSAPGQTAEETNSATSVAGLYRHPLSGQEVITLSDPLYGDAQSEAALRVGYVRIRDVQPEEIVQINLVGEVNAARGGVNGSDELKGILARLNAVEAENAQLKQGTAPDQASQVPGGEQAKVDGANAVNAQASTTDVAPVQNVAVADGVGGNTSTTPTVPAVTPADASVTGGAQPDQTQIAGGPATGQVVPVTPTSDVSAATSQEAQAGAAQAAGDTDADENTPDGASTLPLTDQSTDELKETASAEGLDVTNLSTNEDLIAAIEAKRAESSK